MALITRLRLLPRLKKEKNYTSTPLFGLHSLFLGKIYPQLLQRNCNSFCTEAQNDFLSQGLAGKLFCSYFLTISHDSFLLYPFYVTVNFLTSISRVVSIFDGLSNHRQTNLSISVPHRYSSLDSRICCLQEGDLIKRPTTTP